ncbi:TetR/AcrR family transcriptional regulator [Subtercola sp. PAMC28395]|uniref:TetR/AcrR family transcriptional regulator n=1 Tax=Subtercola sp. PAMC28395 TaxID=2846775 RepID=UPI001C0B2AB3|nr:TetR/AcrR family transcriptional regulator [Subtercola sp. PAMC28395]QWT24150.1 TetR/AcrR family transcriptional regulator [Subtercola sp. PAMC28395]
MQDGATIGRRERRKQETASSLTSVTRRLTAERGLAGFTIEEVCEQVDVSRRTFFNYFATKEDAVIGVDPEEEAQQFASDFLALGSHGWPAVIDDLIALIVQHVESSDLVAAEHTVFWLALEREPHLMVRFIGISRERDRQAAAFIAEREGVSPDDPHARAVVSILSTLLRSAGEELFDPSNTREFSEIINEALTAYRSVLTTDQTRLSSAPPRKE